MTTQIDPRIDHYKVLGVSENADADDIKKAYRKLAKKYHPDRTGGDKAKESRFKQISQAYDVLGNSEKRQQYDALRSGAFGGMPGGFNGDFGPGFSADGFGGLGDIFSQMFSGATGRGGPGVRFRYSRGGPTSHRQQDPYQAAHDAQYDGRRRQATPEAVTERKIRLPDGSRATQRGNHVYSEVRLAIDQAIMGTTVDVSTLGGTSKIKIPPGTASGVKLRLKGKGATISESPSGGRGNHYVTVHIDVPKNIDDKAKKLLIQFMRQVKKS